MGNGVRSIPEHVKVGVLAVVTPTVVDAHRAGVAAFCTHTRQVVVVVLLVINVFPVWDSLTPGIPIIFPLFLRVGGAEGVYATTLEVS